MGHDTPRIGWIGTGRMGLPMAERLLRAGYPVAVFNRTRAKAEPLAALGATVVATAATSDGAAFVRDLGADKAVDYRKDLVGEVKALRPNGVDAVLHAGWQLELSGLSGL